MRQIPQSTNAATLLILSAAPIGFLAVPHWINAALFLLTILLPIHSRMLGRPTPISISENKQSTLILLGLLAPILAVLLGQIFRGEWHWPDFDAPSRLILGAVVYMALVKVSRPSPSEMVFSLTIGLAITLALLPLGITTQAVQRWGGRFATALSDTNTFGSYVGLMLVLFSSLLMFFKSLPGIPPKAAKGLITVLALVSITAAVWALAGSRSRGAWIATAGATFAACWMLVADTRSNGAKALSLAPISFMAFTAIVGVIAAMVLATGAGGPFGRLESIVTELFAAIQGHYRPDSTGVRVQMYRAALDLFLAAPMTGYGDLNYRFVLDAPWLTSKYPPEVLQMLAGAGPHSELFGRALQSGLWGVIGTTLFLGIPSVIFWQNKRKDRSDIGQSVNSAGLIMMIYLVLVQFTIEFTLKHTASFNAFIFGLLLAISVKSAHAQKPKSQTIV